MHRQGCGLGGRSGRSARNLGLRPVVVSLDLPGLLDLLHNFCAIREATPSEIPALSLCLKKSCETCPLY